MKFINLTPHEIRVQEALTSPEVVFPPSGRVARAKEQIDYQDACLDDDSGIYITLFRHEYSEVENLPEPDDIHMYIVSGLVKAAVPYRTDVVCPSQLQRNDKGQVTGAKGLAVLIESDL